MTNERAMEMMTNSKMRPNVCFAANIHDVDMIISVTEAHDKMPEDKQTK